MNSDTAGSIYVTTPTGFSSQLDKLQDTLNNKRFFINPELDIFKYIDGLYTATINQEDCFYRARVGDYKEVKDLHAAPKEKNHFGRFHPKGFSYLYAASEIKTAVAEVRPWQTIVTIAECKAKTELTLLDFTRRNEKLENSDMDYRTTLDNEFSKPINPNTSESDYLLTQIIAEYIKNKGIAGIKYSSSVNDDGYNIVVFDPKVFDIKIMKQVNVSKILYEF
ncbi:RES family NAD+ phosphorylase [Marinicrinis lubricantis]|uniref:RES family NAD+ phosphorylase n=1 Tax=Marinicrinis lubricantis TaxID=2086470 RepID=A0ABW1IP02_9BACL